MNISLNHSKVNYSDMTLITESFKQSCPHCNGDGFDIQPECCGHFNSNDFVDKICCLKPNPVMSYCEYCKGTGMVDITMAVRPEWIFPEISVKEFTL